jgi:hypothetical protein
VVTTLAPLSDREILWERLEKNAGFI